MNKNITRQIYRLIDPNVKQSVELAKLIVRYCNANRLFIMLDNYMDIGNCIHVLNYNEEWAVDEKRDPVHMTDSTTILGKVFSTSNVSICIHDITYDQANELLDKRQCYITSDGVNYIYSYDRLQRRKQDLHEELIKYVNNCEKIQWSNKFNDDMFSYVRTRVLSQSRTVTLVPCENTDYRIRIARERLNLYYKTVHIHGFDVIVHDRNAIAVRIVDSDFSLYDNKSLAERARSVLNNYMFNTVTVVLVSISGCLHRYHRASLFEHRMSMLKTHIDTHIKYPPLFGLRSDVMFMK